MFTIVSDGRVSQHVRENGVNTAFNILFNSHLRVFRVGRVSLCVCGCVLVCVCVCLCVCMCACSAGMCAGNCVSGHSLTHPHHTVTSTHTTERFELETWH